MAAIEFNKENSIFIRLFEIPFEILISLRKQQLLAFMFCHINMLTLSKIEKFTKKINLCFHIIYPNGKINTIK